MPWVRLDEQFARHPKVAAAGPLGMALQVAGLCYCNQYLTDGFVPRYVVPSLLNLEGIGMNIWHGDVIGGGEDATWELVLQSVIDAGLWSETDRGYLIHDYLKYQPSKADVEAERRQKSEAGRIGGINSAIKRKAKTSRKEAGAKAAAKHPPQQNASTSSSETQAESKPDPDTDTNPRPLRGPTTPQPDETNGPGSEDEEEPDYDQLEHLRAKLAQTENALTSPFTDQPRERTGR